MSRYLTAILLLFLGAALVYAESEEQAQARNAKAMLGRAPVNNSATPAVQLFPGFSSLIDGPAYGAELLTNGWLRIDLANPAGATPIGTTTGDYFGGDFGPQGVFYALDFSANTLVMIDTASGSAITIGPATPQVGHSWTGLSYDESGQTMYAASTNIAQSALYSIDLSNGAATLIGTTADAPGLIDISVGPTGDMYGHDIVNDAIYLIDKATGAATMIGSTGFDANFAQGMDFNPMTGDLYLAAYNSLIGAAELRLVDLATGNTTLIGPIGAGSGVEVGAFGVVGTGADDLDPNPPANFTAYSDYTNPTGMSLTWDDPTTLVNGTPLNPGDFTIEIERDGAFVASVSGGTGSYMDAGLTDGQFYTYEIYAKLIANDSTSTRVSAGWTAGGAPVPDAPTSFSVTATGSDLQMNWTSPARNIDGTPLDDFAGINLYEDGALVATFARTASDTGIVDSALYTPPAGTHQYWVTAIDNESPQNESAPSNTSYSPIGLPFFDDFQYGPPAPNSGFWLNVEATVSDSAINPPSTPWSLTMDGYPHSAPETGDIVTILPLDMSAQAGNGIVLSYWYQPQGTGNAPESGDSLAIDFLNDLGQWKTVRHYPGTPQVPFVNDVISLDSEDPGPGASFFHAGFQFRFRNRATVSQSSKFDHWFIDNIFFGVPTADPVMLVNPLALTDTVLVNGSTTLNFSVSNISPLPSTLNFTITEDPEVSWLDAVPDSGILASNESATIAVSMDAAGLPAGTYSTDLIVTGNDPANPEDTVAVTLVVNDAPVISVTPDTIDVSLPPDSSVTRILTVQNTGAGPLDFVINIEQAALAKAIKIKYGDQQLKGYVSPTNNLPDEADPARAAGLLRNNIPDGYPPFFHAGNLSANLPELMYYKFNEAGQNQTENFALPGSPVPQFAQVLGGMTMGGNGQYGAALIGTGGPSSSDYVDTGWQTSISGDWAISFWVNNMPSTTQLHYFWGDNDANSFRCFTGGIAGANNLMVRMSGVSWNDVLISNVGPGPAVVDVIYDSSVPEVRAYVDGVLNNTVPEPLLTIQSSGGPFKVGGYSSLDGIPVAMLMDEFKMYNSIPSGITWLNADTLFGSVPPGGALDITLTIDPAGLLGGDYNANVVFLSNDPVTPEFRVGVHLFVIGQVAIDATPNPLVFPDPVFVNGDDTQPLTVINNGNGLLSVSDIVSTNGVFSVDRTSFSVQPFSTELVNVTFSPTAPGLENGTLEISSNDPNTPVLSVGVEGTGILGPEISVSPDSINEALSVNDSTDVIIAIENIAPAGAASLNWSASLTTTMGNSTLGLPPVDPADVLYGPADPSLNRAPVSPGQAGQTQGNNPIDVSSVGYGAELLSNTWYRIPLAAPSAAVPLGSTSGDFFGGDFGPNDVFYALDFTANTLVMIDTSTGASVNIGPSTPQAGQSWTGLSYDVATGTMFAVSTDISSSWLYVIDLGSGAVAPVGSTTDAPGLIDIAVSPAGDIFGHDIVNDAIFIIDKATGAATMIGLTGFDANFAQGMDFNPETGDLFLAAYNNAVGAAELRLVDLATGNTVLVGPIGAGSGVEVGAFGIPGAATGQFIKLVGQTSGTIAPGDVQGLTTRLYGLDVADTTYYAQIEIASNDASDPTVIIPVVIHVGITGIETETQLPTTFAVSPNYPNPFNPSTTINFQLPEAVDVKLVVYNVLGQKVRTLVSKSLQAGRYQSVWDGSNDAGAKVSSGVYIYRFEAGDFSRVKKMILLK